jgi:hypothetical protein
VTALVQPWTAGEEPHRVDVTLPVAVEARIAAPSGASAIWLELADPHPYEPAPFSARVEADGEARFTLGSGSYVAFTLDAEGTRAHETTFEVRPSDSTRRVPLR